MAYMMDIAERRFMDAVSSVRLGWFVMPAESESKDVNIVIGSESQAMKEVLPKYNDWTPDHC